MCDTCIALLCSLPNIHSSCMTMYVSYIYGCMGVCMYLCMRVHVCLFMYLLRNVDIIIQLCK